MSQLGSDFMNFYQKYQVATLIGIQDWADRMSYAHSTIIFLLCTAIVSAKTYILSPLACHVPTVPSGSDFDSYFDSYCWVHGTTPIRMNETIPEDDVAWTEFERERKITYYQWVPFILGLQTILFYLPHVAWQNVTFNRLGADLTAIIVKAMDALKTTSPSKRETMIANVAKRLELLLFAHRDFRRGKKAALKRRLHAACGIFLVSKRMGTWTVFSYLCIKILYLVNAVGQLYLMKHFLGYGEDMVGFGLTITHSLVAGIKWPLFGLLTVACAIPVQKDDERLEEMVEQLYGRLIFLRAKQILEELEQQAELDAESVEMVQLENQQKHDQVAKEVQQLLALKHLLREQEPGESDEPRFNRKRRVAALQRLLEEGASTADVDEEALQNYIEHFHKTLHDPNEA